jgi:hypothetical protein
MAVSPDRTVTMVFNSGDLSLTQINNSTEVPLTAILLPDQTQSMVFSTDSKTVYIAVRNAVVGTNPAPATNGAIEIYSVANDNISGTIPIPRVSRLAISPNGATLLAFSDLSNQVTIVNTATNTTTTTAAVFDNPITAFFSADSSTAYVLSCGPACGGTTASVTVLNIAAATAGQSASLAPATATAGYFDGTNLYVAGPVSASGTVNLANPGALNVLTVTNNTTLSLVKSNIGIGTGSAQVMTLGSNNKLFIGATSCVNAPTGTSVPGGCLSIYNTSTGAVVIDGPVKAGDKELGFVTGMAVVPKRSVVYVTEGGALLVYDTTTSAQLVGGNLVGIVGNATDVKIIDQ